MSDPTVVPGASRARADVSEQIGRSLSTIWQRREGVRPVTIETEYVGDVVRCVIQPGEPSAEEADEPRAADPPDAKSYDREAQGTVARLTKRSVFAYIAKENSKTDQVTNTFILEAIRVKH
jgi:hypothetical protein